MILKDRNALFVTKVIVAAVLLMMILPFLLFGENNYITIHDNLDQFPPFWSISKKVGLFSLDVLTGVMDNTPAVYFGWGGLTIQNLVYYFLPTYIAYVLIYVIALLVGFFSMYKLQCILLGNEHREILLFTSLLFAILPIIPAWSISVASTPLACILFYKIYKEKSKYCFWAVFFLPFLMEFNCSTLFVCGFWLIGVIIASIKDKRFHFMLLYAFLLLCLGVLIFNFKLFYMQFFLCEDLNRNHMIYEPVNMIIGLYHYVIDGYYQVPSIQKYLLIPVCCITFCYVIRHWIKKNSANRAQVVFLVSGIMAFVCSFIAAADDALWLEGLKNTISVLKGFSFFRIYVFSRLFFYIAFCASLILCLRNRYLKYAVPFVLLIQLGIILISHTWYNDSFHSLVLNMVPSLKKDVDLTWKEFYDEALFAKIKKEIGYDGEPVAAVGYHEAVLMYNDFNCIGGYLSYYPYKDMQKYRRLIEPQLNVNEKFRNYYDVWGGRRYLFCEDVDYNPSRRKCEQSVELLIDADVFRNEFGGKYILSRAKIVNALELGFEFLGEWESSEGVYTMYVYEMK